MQVGIIRQVEVELESTLADLRDSHKEESAKVKKWRALDKDVQAKLAEFPIQAVLSRVVVPSFLVKMLMHAIHSLRQQLWGVQFRLRLRSLNSAA